MLSIILPVRNSQVYIEECLVSIARQGGVTEPYELLISDNCSSDGTVEEIERILRENPTLSARTRMFPQKENLGVFGNLNFLLKSCTYDHAHIICADDFYSGDDALKRLMEVVRQRSTVPLFSFDNNLRHAEGDWRLIRECTGSDVMEPRDVIRSLFSFGCFLGGLSNICINRRYFAGSEYFDPEYRYYGDIVFYARSAMSGASLYLSDEEITYRREHEKSISSTGNLDNNRSMESLAATELLFRSLCPEGEKAWVLRLYASYNIAQFYHAGIKELLIHRKLKSLSNIIGAQRGKKAFYPPLVCLFIAILIYPKIYRKKLHTLIQPRFARYLTGRRSSSGLR